MPDAIASFPVGGQTYYITANEGDARTEEDRIKDLDPAVFPDFAALQDDSQIGRLNASNIDGDIDGDGDIDQIHVYGSRSFTIWDASGNQVFDSGDLIERITAELVPTLFNSEEVWGTTSLLAVRWEATLSSVDWVTTGCSEVCGTTC